MRAHNGVDANGRMIRDRSMTGWKLDEAKLLELARRAPEFAQVTNKQNIENGPLPQGIYQSEKGYMVVNNEGVHAETDDDGTIQVWFSYGMTWQAVQLDIADVLDCVEYVPPFEVSINLADNIRKFGDRLEMNFAMAWRKCIVGGFQMKPREGSPAEFDPDFETIYWELCAAQNDVNDGLTEK